MKTENQWKPLICLRFLKLGVWRILHIAGQLTDGIHGYHDKTDIPWYSSFDKFCSWKQAYGKY